MAAKLVQVSDTAITGPWVTLPGNAGALNFDADQIEDTVFGNTFQSNEAGLIGWSVEANARYKGFAGYQAKVLKPGTPTAMAAEPCTDLGGDIWQVTAVAKRVIDHNTTALIIYDNSVDDMANVEWIDYLFGKFKFLTAPTGPVTIDADYLPMVSVGTIQSFTLTQTADAIENTDFATAQGNTGYKTHEPGLRQVTLEANGLYSLANAFLASLDARTEFILEINPDGDGEDSTTAAIARGYFRLVTAGESGDVGALEEETVTFQLNVPVDSYALLYRPFGWIFEASTTLATAVQQMLTAWQDETTIFVQYLEDGVAGEKGEAVVTDVSLTSGLDAMNEFAASFMGTGVTTTV